MTAVSRTGSTRIEDRHKAALRALSTYFDDHVEPGEPPCPCESCELARAVFKAELEATS